MRVAALLLLFTTYDVSPRTEHEKVIALRSWHCGYLHGKDEFMEKQPSESNEHYWERVDIVKENFKKNDCDYLEWGIGAAAR